MTRTEHLLWILAEECAEVAQQASKAARFGLSEVQPGQPLDNAARLTTESAHFVAAVEMLEDDPNGLGSLAGRLNEQARIKISAVEEFLRYSAECGTLDQPSATRREATP